MAKKFSLEAVLSLTDKMSAPLMGVEGKLGRLSKSLSKGLGGGMTESIGSLNKGMDKALMGAAAVAGAAIVGGVAIGKSFVDAAAEAEKYKATLKTMLGSQEAANKRFDEMSKFAASTPFELNEVVTLGNQLQAVGQYSVEAMTTLGDLAAASGKPIDQVTGAFAKLVSGQKGEAVNMFRDLLISTKDWSAATGKGIKKTGELMATTDEMIAALPKILGKKGFSGMMDELSKSYGGMSSNLSDTITRFKQQIGGQLLPYAKNLIGALTESLSRFSDIAGDKAAGGISKLGAAMDRLAEFIRNIDWAKVVDGLLNFITGIVKFIEFVKPLLPLLAAFVVGVKLLTAALVILNLVAMANPIGLITVAIVAAIAAITLLIAHWNSANKAMIIAKKTMMTLVAVGFAPIIIAINTILLGLRAMGKLFGMDTAKLDAFQESMNDFVMKNTFISGTMSTAEYDAAKAAAPAGRYASPSTRGSESRTYAETRSTSEVFVRPDRGAVVSPSRGGPAVPALNYGGRQ